MTHSAWFESWDSLYKILVSSITGYMLLILFVRLVGKRATSKMNNFDWIVTVAIGSVFASMAVLKDVTVADGATAMLLLLGLQYLLTQATSRWNWARKGFLAPPSLLFYRGVFQEQEMKKQRISRDEIVSAIREQGFGTWEGVEAVILEPDAELAVVRRGTGGELETIKGVRGLQDADQDLQQS